MIDMTFEEWLENESGWGGVLLAEGQLAKAAWNAATKVAADKVREHFDEQEAWITPEEIESLSA